MKPSSLLLFPCLGVCVWIAAMMPGTSSAWAATRSTTSAASGNVALTEQCSAELGLAQALRADRVRRLESIRKWLRKEHEYRRSFRDAQRDFSERLMTDLTAHLSRGTISQLAKLRKAEMAAESWERRVSAQTGGTRDSLLRKWVSEEKLALQSSLEADLHHSLMRVLSKSGVTAPEPRTSGPNTEFEATLPLMAKTQAERSHANPVRLRFSLELSAAHPFDSPGDARAELGISLKLLNRSSGSELPPDFQQSLELFAQDAALLVPSRDASTRSYANALQSGGVTPGLAPPADFSTTLQLADLTQAGQPVTHFSFHSGGVIDAIVRASELIRSYQGLLLVTDEDCVAHLYQTRPLAERKGELLGLLAVHHPVLLEKGRPSQATCDREGDLRQVSAGKAD